MSTPEKEAIVKEVSDTMSRAKSIYLTDFTGLSVEDANKLRRSFREHSVEYRVVKNTLARLSVKSAGCEDLLEHLEGPTGMAFGFDDPVAPARVIKNFSKDSDKLKVRVALFEGVLIGSDKIKEIANLPSREELLGKLVGVLNAPIVNLAYSLNGLLSKLALAVDAVKKQKEEQEN